MWRLRVSVMIEGQMGLNWANWKRLVRVVEDCGFHGLYRSDHFSNPSPPDADSLELIVSLTYLAEASQRLVFGPLVSPVSFRDPVMLARQAAALSDLSDGRFILGLGAGWQEREHEEHGYSLLDVPSRIARLGEGLEVATRLLSGQGPQTFDGEFFQLNGAELRPRPEHLVPILVGGNGPTRTLPLVARYADIWNGLAPTADLYRERCTRLDVLLAEEGRKPADLRRTMMTGVVFGSDAAALERKIAPMMERPHLAGKTTSEVVELMRARGMIAGVTSEVVEQLRAYEDAGVDEIMLQWLDLDDIDGLEALADVTRAV